MAVVVTEGTGKVAVFGQESSKQNLPTQPKVSPLIDSSFFSFPFYI